MLAAVYVADDPVQVGQPSIGGSDSCGRQRNEARLSSPHPKPGLPLQKRFAEPEPGDLLLESRSAVFRDVLDEVFATEKGRTGVEEPGGDTVSFPNSAGQIREEIAVGTELEQLLVPPALAFQRRVGSCQLFASALDFAIQPL